MRPLLRYAFVLWPVLVLAVALRGDDAAVDEKTQPPDWTGIAKVIGTTGTLKDNVYTIEVPRTDLDVSVEGMAVPPGAIPSTFRFYKCSCGKMVVAGEFCVLEYEANDVIDKLHGAQMMIGGMTPAMVNASPRILLIRFYGEAHGLDIATPIKAALDCTGPARTATQPSTDVSPPMDMNTKK